MADNGNGVGSFDEDALKHTVQTLPKGKPSAPRGMDAVIWLAQTIDEFAPWGIDVKTRDQQLRNFITVEPIFASALATVCSRNAAMPWKIEGPDEATESAQTLLQTANFGKGWQDFCIRLSLDLYTQDNGAFVEVIRAKDRPEDPVIGIANLDSARCWHTGHPEVPVMYLDREGRYHYLKWYQVVALTEMPAPHEGLSGLQYSALTRLLKSVRTQRDIDTYMGEKISGRNPRAITLVKGVTADSITEAWTRAGFLNDAAGLTRYSNPIFVSATSPEADVGFDTFDIASIPDGFDLAENFKQYIAKIAMAFLSDYQEFAPLPGGGLGTASQSETQHKKSSRTGIALYRNLMQHFINWDILPDKVEMTFEEPDLDAENAKAMAANTRATERKARIESGEITPGIARMRALGTEDLTQEEYDEAEKQAEEAEKKAEEEQAAQMEQLQQQQEQGGGGQPDSRLDDDGTPASQNDTNASRMGDEQRGKALSRPRSAVEKKVEQIIDTAFEDLWASILEKTGAEDIEAESRKFRESDWIRNGGKFADFVGGGSGGGGGAGGAAERAASTVAGPTLAKGGATYNLRSKKAPQSGYAVSPYPERSKSVSVDEFKKGGRTVVRDYVNENYDLLQQPKHYLGTWHDAQSGKVYLDVTVIERTRDRAFALATERDQIAIFDLAKGEEITVNRLAKSGGAAKVRTMARRMIGLWSLADVPEDEVEAFSDAVADAVLSGIEGSTEKFAESDWVRNRGRFADFVGRRGGGGAAGGAAGAAEDARGDESGYAEAANGWVPGRPHREIRQRREIDEWADTIERQSKAVRPNAESAALANRLKEKGDRIEPEITADMKALASRNRAELAGLEFAKKSESSLARKIEADSVKDRITREEAASSIGDVVRYTVQIPPTRYTDGVSQFRKDLTDRGYQEAKFKNYWDGDAYRGINTNWVTPDGDTIEIQFHTKASWTTKEGNHKAYEVWRDVSNPIPQTAKDHAAEVMASRWQNVRTPTGVTSLR